jgi:predicted TPR repeat methyltransferase
LLGQHISSAESSQSSSVKDYLAMGDDALANDDMETAIHYYKQGLRLVSVKDSGDSQELYTQVPLSIQLSLYTNLGTAVSTLGHNSQATQYYEHALQIYDNYIQKYKIDANEQSEATLIAAQTAFFLGQVYQDQDKIIEAAEVYHYAFQLDPLHWAAIANLGALLQSHSNLIAKHQANDSPSKSYSPRMEALRSYKTAYAILTSNTTIPTDPPPEPRFILSQLQYLIGMLYWSFQDDYDNTLKRDPSALENVKHICSPDTTSAVSQPTCRERAAHAFSQARTYDPDNASAQHMLATVTADATMTRASNVYIQSLFDDYADTFETSLVKELGYDGYARLRRGFDRAMQTDSMQFDKVLDAGCGTGLVGEQFRNISRVLIGVDLSASIIAQAEQKRPGLYNRTIADDVIAVMRRETPLSLIVAGDSFIYFGDLQPLMAAMYVGLEVGGYAAFTLENVDTETERYLDESKGDQWRWQLTASGRFAHRKGYVIQVGREHQLQMIHYEPMDGFRSEGGVAVRGHMFVMQKVEQNDEL